MMQINATAIETSLTDAKEMVDAVFMAAADFDAEDYRRDAIRTTAHLAGEKIGAALTLLGSPPGAVKPKPQFEIKSMPAAANEEASQAGDKEPKHPRLTRREAFDLVSDMEDNVLHSRGLARVLFLIASGIRDSQMRDALDSVARTMEETADGIIEMRKRLWRGLDPSHDHDPALA